MIFFSGNLVFGGCDSLILLFPGRSYTFQRWNCAILEGKYTLFMKKLRFCRRNAPCLGEIVPFSGRNYALSHVKLRFCQGRIYFPTLNFTFFLGGGNLCSLNLVHANVDLSKDLVFRKSKEKIQKGVGRDESYMYYFSKIHGCFGWFWSAGTHPDPSPYRRAQLDLLCPSTFLHNWAWCFM